LWRVAPALNFLSSSSKPSDIATSKSKGGVGVNGIERKLGRFAKAWLFVLFK
jgi:hypothetical protein